MATKLRPLAQHCKRLLPLLAAPAALLLIQGQAKALLTYNIFESGSNVVVETSGSLDLTGAIFNSDQFCVDGAIQSIFALLCTGTSVFTPTYNIVGPTLFDGTVNIFPASNVSGTSTILVGEPIFGVCQGRMHPVDCGALELRGGFWLGGRGRVPWSGVNPEACDLIAAL
jgi:hypothetical protein